jgi:predicted neuraminidase
MKRLRSIALILATAAPSIAQRPSTATLPQTTTLSGHPSIVRSDFVFTRAPFASAHASTIVSTGGGLVVAWFGGTAEGARDVGIWLSRYRRGAWTAPARVASGTQRDGRRFPTWNPVLFETAPGQLTLFFKVGPNPREWWGMAQTSKDGGVTWSAARRLADGTLGPVKNKPIRLADGALLAGGSTESRDSVSKWRIHFERSDDQGRTWSVVRPPMADSTLNAIQPALLTHRGTWLQALMRTQSGRVFETWSDNAGQTWSVPARTTLPNPNAGLDAITLFDGRQMLVYNHTASGRTPLSVAVSHNGITWSAPISIETAAGEYSYPAVIQTPDSLVHVTYTWQRRRIRHVVIDPRRLASPRNFALDSVLATLTPKLAPLAASRDSLAMVIVRDSGTSRGDSSVMRFRESASELLKTIVQTFDDSAFQLAIFPADSARRVRLRQTSDSARFVPPDFAVSDSLTRFLNARGVWLFRDEGATYFTLNESDLLATLGRYLRGSLRAYLRLEAAEQMRPSVEDARLRISLDGLADRLAEADSFATQFRSSQVFQQIEWRRASYLYLMLNGVERSPAFATNGELRTTLRQALERFATRYTATASGRVVRDYLALLRASNFRDEPAVAEFRQRVRDAAGPRG